MTFILPTALRLHTQTADDNVGTDGSVTDSSTGDSSLILRSKSGGNLPITDSASRVQYYDNSYGMGGGAAQGVFFGMSSTSQATVGSFDPSTDPLLMVWSVQFNSPNRIQVADQSEGGVRFWVGSGSTPNQNYREYYIGGNDTPFASAMAGPVTICVDLNSQGYDNQVGTFVSTDVSAYGIATVHESISGSQYGEIHCQRAHLLQASASSATKPIPFFLTNPIVSPETFATCGVEIISNGAVGDTLEVGIDFASFTYTLVTNDANGNVANTAISFVAAWNASTDSDVSDYTATHDGAGRMIFTHDTAVDGEVLYPSSIPDGSFSMFTADTTGVTGATYTPLLSTSFDSAVTAVQGIDYSDKIGNWLTKTGSTYFIPVPFAFGNGVQPINFSDNNVSVESPANAATGQKNFRTETRTMAVFSRVRLDSVYAAGAATSSYDSISLGGTYTWGTPSPWDFNIDGEKSNVALSGTFKGMGDITMGSTVTASGAFTLDSAATVISSGADISDININGNLKILGKSVTTFNNVDCSGNITFASDGEYSFTGQGSLGTFINDSGSNITINIAIGVAYTNNNVDSSITINQITKTLTLTGLVTGTEVRVYDSTTFAALGGIEDSASSGIFTMNLTSNQVDIVIHHIEYVHIRLSGIDSTESINTPIVQRLDRGYSA